MEEEQHEGMQGTIRKGKDHANKILRELQMAKVWQQQGNMLLFGEVRRVAHLILIH